MALKKSWTDTVDRGITDIRWDGYDTTIKTEVKVYNSRHSKKFDWLYVKAILWTESGGPDNKEWKKRPMQIGRFADDKGYQVVRDGKEGSLLVMGKQKHAELKGGKITDPKINIKFAIAYLYTRLAKFAVKSVRDPKDKKVYTYKIVSGDTFPKIAKKVGTTVDELKAMNKQAAKGLYHPGDILKYRKAKMQQVITDWRKFSTAVLQDRYNGNGDKDYSKKLDYVLDTVFPKLKRPSAKKKK